MERGRLGSEGEWDSEGEGDLSTAQRPHIQIPSRGGLELQHTNFGRDTNIQSITENDRFQMTVLSITVFLIKDNLVKM